jgi:hypothetical protein
MGITTDTQDDEQFSHDDDQVLGEKHTEDEQLQFWIICYSQEKEFLNSCLVYVFHV